MTDSFIGRIGGKKLLRKQIIAEFSTDFGRYIEVFGGAAWVLLAREKHAKMKDGERFYSVNLLNTSYFLLNNQ